MTRPDHPVILSPPTVILSGAKNPALDFPLSFCAPPHCHSEPPHCHSEQSEESRPGLSPVLLRAPPLSF
jgi:hypothetical protein